MRLLEQIVLGTIGGLVMVVSAGAATTHSYSGAYPVTVTRSQHSNGTYCLTLTDNGQYGALHSGSASLVISGHKYTYGTFQVLNHTIVATIQAQGYGQNAGLVFIGHATLGNIGDGVFEDVYGGEDFDSGALSFGVKGGC
jgi:hypothetical protein